MRLVSAILFVALTGVGAARSIADDAKPADPKPEVTKKKVPFRVVKMLPETGQVLLFDKNHGNHVVAEVGQTLDGYLVDEIDEDEVMLLAENGAQIILTSPPPPRVAKRTAAKKPEPADPYNDAASTDAAAPAPKLAAEGPVDPYAEPEAPTAPGDGGVRVASATDPSMATAAPAVASAEPAVASAEPAGAPAAPKQAPPPPPVFVDTAPAPSDPYADPGIAAFVEAVGATPAPTPPAAPAKAKKPTKGGKAAPPSDNDAAAALASAATGSTAAPTTSAAKTPSVTIARSELDAALANFGQLAGSFKATFTPDGLRFDAVHEGTLLSKVGLRRGDLITYVDGQPLRSLDDAATLYARAGTVKHTTLQIVRDGKLVTVRVAIQ